MIKLNKVWLKHQLVKPICKSINFDKYVLLIKFYIYVNKFRFYIFISTKKSYKSLIFTDLLQRKHYPKCTTSPKGYFKYVIKAKIWSLNTHNNFSTSLTKLLTPQIKDSFEPVITVPIHAPRRGRQKWISIRTWDWCTIKRTILMQVSQKSNCNKWVWHTFRTLHICTINEIAKYTWNSRCEWT